MVDIDITYEGDLSTRCVHSVNGAEIVTDAPEASGGLERFFSPTDLLAASFGSCMLTIMGFTAKRLGVDIKGARVKVSKEMSETGHRRIGKLRIEFSCSQGLSDEVIGKLTQSMEKCAVHKSLHPDIVIESIYRWGED